MKYFCIFAIVFLICMVGIPNVNAGDTFNIDTNLTEYNPHNYPVENPNWFKPDKNSNFNFSNSSNVCPSNQCQATKLDGITLILDPAEHTITLLGEFNLVDNKSNGHFGPKKQEFIEEMDMTFFCKFNDIQEDIAKNTTKYVCSKPNYGNVVDKNIFCQHKVCSEPFGDITRVFNETAYPYTFTATFETPSNHLVFNANEEHFYPHNVMPLSINKHWVFKN